MSVRAITWAWDAETRTTTERLVLLALADNADDHGRCWPSLRTVASKCRLSVRQTARIVADLEQQQLLRREIRLRPNGSQTSNILTLTMPDPPCHRRHPPPVMDDIPPLSPVTSPEPSLEPSREPTPIAPLRRKRRTDPLTDFANYLKETGQC